MKKRMVCLLFLLGTIMIIPIDTGITENNKAPKGFAFNNPSEFNVYPNFHGGAGTIKYVEGFGPADFETSHRFFRVGVIPPGSSIGEYRAMDADELFMIMKGMLLVTVNGRTARIVGPSMVPCRMGETIGMYNPGKEDVSFAWIATAERKGDYNPVDLGNDLSGKRYEEPCPFTWIPMDYGGFRITIRSAHKGKGPIYDTFGRLGFDYYKTHWGAFYLVLPPGTSIGYHQHNIHEEMYFVVSGRARGTVDDVTMDMKPGDCALCPLGSSHGIYNNGTEDLGIICTLLSSLPGGKLDAKDHGDDLTGR